MRLVVVGYGPGGVYAALAAKMFAPDMDVIILTKETIPAHRRPGITLGFKSVDTDVLTIPEWTPEALAKKGIEVRQGVTVTDGDSSNKILTLEGGSESTLKYDKLVLATGGRSVLPNLPGIELDGVYTVQDLMDAKRVAEAVKDASSVVVIGAGFIGLEAAERLYELKKDVHIVVRSRLLRRLLEPEMSAELAARIPSGVHVHLGLSPEQVIGEECVRCVSLGTERIDTEVVLCVTGIVPETALAESLGVKIGKLGGVVVNERMETSVPDIYAVGDCIEIKDFLTGKPILLPVASAAAREGRQAGAVIAGKNKIYPDVALRFQYDYIFGTEIVTVGASTTEAAAVGIDTKVQYLYDPAEYTKVALVTDHDGRFIGGQILSSRMAAPIGYQIMSRIGEGAKIEERPLTKFRHDELKAVLEEVIGPIKS